MSAREWKAGDVALFRVERWSSAMEWPVDTSCVLMRLEGDYWVAVEGDPAAPFCVHVKSGALHPLVAIDYEDEAAVERLLGHYLTNYDGMEAVPSGGEIAAMQVALREFANPTPRRVWTDGDVVQHIDGNYTAQRHDGEWRTTTGGKGDSKGWGSDEYVTNHVEAGRLRVLREQAAEANA